MTKEECLAIGGHCYEHLRVISDKVEEYCYRQCKHCGHTQKQRQVLVSIPVAERWEDI